MKVYYSTPESYQIQLSAIIGTLLLILFLSYFSVNFYKYRTISTIGGKIENKFACYKSTNPKLGMFDLIMFY